MDILIKNMEMPESCLGCPFDNVKYTPRKIGKDTYSSYDWHECFVVKKDCTKIAREGRKAKWCPLNSVPEHDDLVSRKAILSYFNTVYQMGADMDYEDAVAIVSNEKAIPTILEKSK